MAAVFSSIRAPPAPQGRLHESRLLTIAFLVGDMLMRRKVTLHLASRARTNVNPLAGRNIQWKTTSSEGVCVFDSSSAT